MAQNFKKICEKQNILLEYNKNADVYSLLFKINNKNKINIKELLEGNIFELLKKLNNEIIEDVVEIIKKDNENIILFIFKEIGKEAGLRQKYMFLNNIKIFEHNNLIINTKSVTKQELMINNLLNKESLEKINKLQEINCEYAKLTINKINEIDVDMHYIFKIIINDDLPKYLENIIGLLMKKIFLNLKIFIENS